MRFTSKLLKDSSGNFALTFGIFAVPVMLAGGLAVDYVGMSMERSKLQDAADAAALAVAREGKISDEQALLIAKTTISATYGIHVAKLTATTDGETAVVTATKEQPLVFQAFVGKKEAEVTVTAEASYAYTNYEIALVINTNHLMDGGKLSSMQKAVVGLIQDMKDLGLEKEQIKFSLVPYSDFVNVGPEYGPKIDKHGNLTQPAAAWIDQDAKAPLPQSDLPSEFSRFAMFKHLNVEWPGCVETRVPNGSDLHDVSDTTPDPSDPQSLFTPFFAIDEPDESWRYPNSYLPDNGQKVTGWARRLTEADKIAQLTRYGMKGPFKKPKNIKGALGMVAGWKKVTVDDSVSTFYTNRKSKKGPGFGCDIEPIVPLTSDLDKVKKTVKKLKASGSTNMLEGVMWGWRTLSDREPFSEGAPKSDKSAQKIMIFMSDSPNSFGNLNNDLGSGYTSMGYLVDGRLNDMTAGNIAQTTNALDEKTLAACSNAKEDGIKIYTIRLEESNAATGEMLTKCASSSAHYFDAPSRQQLSPIFETIQKGMVRLRLTS